MMIQLLLILALKATSQTWAIKITCASGVELCADGTMNSALFSTIEEAAAEADRIAKEGCWYDPYKLRCSSLRSVESFDKLAPGGITSLTLRQTQ